MKIGYCVAHWAGVTGGAALFVLSGGINDGVGESTRRVAHRPPAREERRLSSQVETVVLGPALSPRAGSPAARGDCNL
jgi:hypothetical protein